MSTDDHATVADVARELVLDEGAALDLVHAIAPHGTVRLAADDLRVPANALEQLRAACS